MCNKLTFNQSQIDLNKEIKEIRSANVDFHTTNGTIIDLSDLKTYTIDDPNTLEIDDAISLERIDQNYKLWIHIASPATYINYNSYLDKRARKLISTQYLATSNIYMFPSIVIDKIFSLTQKCKRAALSLGIIFNNDATVSSSEIVQSIINVNYQLSYLEADELIDYAPKEEEDLSIISRILEKRKSWRIKRGAKEILESYGKVKVIDKIPTINVTDQTISRTLISEAMIIYGDLMSNYTKINNIPVPYRVQERKTDQVNYYKSSLNNQILYNHHLKKNMGKTYYSISPLSHSSLGLTSYLHATSPIRRYADLLVHYQINRYLNKKDLISKEQINININQINNIGRQNISKYREDQKIWINKWFEGNSFKEYKVIFLNWTNRSNNICIIYFVEFSFSLVCYLKTKFEIKEGDSFTVSFTNTNFKDMLYFQLIS